MEKKKFDLMINRLRIIASLIPPVSLVFCVIALIGIPLKQSDLDDCSRVFIVGSGLLAMLSGGLIAYAFRFVLKYLGKI